MFPSFSMRTYRRAFLGACGFVGGWKGSSKPPHSKAAASAGGPYKTWQTTLDLKLGLTFSIWGWGVANPIWRKAMNSNQERFGKVSRRSGLMLAGAALALLILSSEAAGLKAQNSEAPRSKEKDMPTTQSKFYCNVKALTPEERARHKQLSEKLLAARKEIVETANGYEFQFSPKDISLSELADFVAAESKCCPFFDFHIDLEGEGSLLCLRLTGEEGIKPFIRAEFQVSTK
jgi:hypothetical protein